MREGLPPRQEGVPSWVVLADQVAVEPIGHMPIGPQGLPFYAYGERVLDSQQLHSVYLRLYRIACAVAGAGKVDTAAGAEARISYNLAMTKDSIVIMPRMAEGAVVRDKQGREVGRLALNGTVLAGTALVKSEAEWEALRNDPEQLLGILGQIGVDPTTVDYEQVLRDIFP